MHITKNSKQDQLVWLMVFVADKVADVNMLWEKNIVPWQISRADKFKRTWFKIIP
jgi:hypothetical protein